MGPGRGNDTLLALLGGEGGEREGGGYISRSLDTPHG